MIEALIQLGIVLLAIAIGALLGALFLQFITRLVLKFTPPYGMAYKAVLIAGAVSVVVGFVTGFGLGIAGYEFSHPVQASMWPIGLVIATYVYGRVLVHPETGPIGFGKAFLISLTWVAIFIAIVVAISLLEIA